MTDLPPCTSCHATGAAIAAHEDSAVIYCRSCSRVVHGKSREEAVRRWAVPDDGYARAIEDAARLAEEMEEEILIFWDRPGGPPGNGYRNTKPKDVAAAIRKLAPGGGAGE